MNTNNIDKIVKKWEKIIDLRAGKEIAAKLDAEDRKFVRLEKEHNRYYSKQIKIMAGNLVVLHKGKINVY